MSSAKLKGRRVVLTRPEGSGAAWRAALEAAGAEVSELPLLALTYEPDQVMLNEVLEGIGEYDWIVFTSGNGVKGFFDRFFERFRDIRSIGGARLACVGPATEKALLSYHLESDLTPLESDGVTLARKLMTDFDVENQKLLVVTGNLSSNEVPLLLANQGMAIVDVLRTYITDARDVGGTEAAEDFRRQGADVLVFASPSAVESFLHQAASLKPDTGARQPKTVAVGPTTADALRRAGIPIGAVAAQPTPQGIRDAVASALASA